VPSMSPHRPPKDAGLRSLAILIVAVALSGCAGLRPPPPPTAAERGRAVAQGACSACHAVAPGAASPRARAPAFASIEMAHTAGLEGRVAALTRTGHYEMPPVKLTPGQVADVVAYIASLSAPKPVIEHRPLGR